MVHWCIGAWLHGCMGVGQDRSSPKGVGEYIEEAQAEGRVCRV